MDHRMSEVVRDLQATLSNADTQKQAHLDLIVKDHNQVAFESSQDGR